MSSVTERTDGRRITVREAQVKTASVEVKSLTISGKQVTLSVFRQLRNEPVIDDATGELRGVPWGTVNYYWGDCHPDHLHVVWQTGTELRRACLQGWRRETEDRHRLNDQETRYVRAAAALAGSRVLARLETDRELPYMPPHSSDATLLVRGAKGSSITLRIETSTPIWEVVDFVRWYPTEPTSRHTQHIADPALRCGDPAITYGCYDPVLGKPFQRYATPCHHARERSPSEIGTALSEDQAQRVARLRTHINDLVVALGEDGPRSIPFLESLLDQDIQQWHALEAERKAHNAAFARHYAEIEALDQLFIAV